MAPGDTDHDSAASRPPVWAVYPVGAGGGVAHVALPLTVMLTSDDGPLSPLRFTARTRMM